MTGTACELRDCLVHLPEDRARWTRRVGELMDAGGEILVAESISIFCNQSLPVESGKILLTQLQERGQLLPVLQRVYETDRLRFREVLSMAQVSEPRLHTKLTRLLLDLLKPEHMDRTDEILCLFDCVAQVSGLSNLAGVLPTLKQAKDSRLRARAALLASSLPNGRHLLELYREEVDPRVRVSILELLWLDRQPVARLAFEEARRDPQPRVRAYGILGLYGQGDLRALPALMEMAESPNALTRAVTRCAMELLHEPRFETVLERLRKEFGESPVKAEPLSPAVRSGHRSLRVVIPRIKRLPAGGLRVQVSVRLDHDEALDPALRPLDLHACVDGRPVLNYTVNRVALARRLGFGMVLPLTLRAASETTPGIRGVLDCLMSMPDGELRSAGFYRSGLFMRQLGQDLETGPDSALQDARTLRLPVITQESCRFATDLKDSSKEENLAAEPGELALAMLNRLKVQKPVGHIGVILNTAVKGPPPPALAESLRLGCKESETSLHIVAVGQVAEEILTPWRTLSRQSGGFQTTIAEEDELPSVVQRWMLCFREFYCLEFEAPGTVSHLRLQAVHAAGSGEAASPIDSD